MRERAAALIIAAAMVAASFGCAGEVIPIPSPKPPGHSWGLDGSGPITAVSNASLTPEEIREKTGEYTAVNLWANVAHEKARDDPGNFHLILFGELPRECVDDHRNMMLEVPNPPLEELFTCAAETAGQGGSIEWDAVSPTEREARARRSVGLLFWSIDPPSLVTVQIAHRRGLDVTPQNNPDFARFSAMYDECEDLTEEYIAGLAEAERPEEMAVIWTAAEDEITECSNAVTYRLFGKNQRPDAD